MDKSAKLTGKVDENVSRLFSWNVWREKKEKKDDKEQDQLRINEEQ